MKSLKVNQFRYHYKFNEKFLRVRLRDYVKSFIRMNREKFRKGGLKPVI